MKSNPVLWFRRLSLVLAVLGVIGGAWMIISGLFLSPTCTEPFFAFYAADQSRYVCAATNETWSMQDKPRPQANFGLAGAGVAAILFFLWAYALCLAVARKLEQKSAPEAAPQGGAAP